MRRVALALMVSCALPWGARPASAAGPGIATLPCTRPVAVGAAAPVGIESCPGVRPGALVEIPHSVDGDVLCTMGYLVRDTARRLYVTTAGHCYLGGLFVGDHPGQRTWPSGRGPVALDASGRAIGTYVYAAESPPSSSTLLDLGLIALGPGIRASPQVCHFGGPTGIDGSRPRSPVVLELYGQGVGFSLVVPGRSGAAPAMPDPQAVWALMPASNGDSGGPVLSSSGRAVGYVVGTGAAVGYPDSGNVLVYRLGPQLQAAARALRTTLSLVTAKTL